MNREEEQVHYRERMVLRQVSQECSQEEPTPSAICPNCGTNVASAADLCEKCGEWLLKGKCNFCYGDVVPDQKFCAKCGNSPHGIVCKDCGVVSHFDFCPQCHKPLTEMATDAIKEIKQSKEFQELMSIQKEEAPPQEGISDQSQQEVAQVEADSRTLEKQAPTRSFVLNDASHGRLEQNIRAIEESRGAVVNAATKLQVDKQEREAQKQKKEAQVLRLLEEAKQKKFANNQEARRFFGALMITLPAVITSKVPIGWHCNAYGCTHPDGPQGCANPSAGGTWLYEERKETILRKIKI